MEIIKQINLTINLMLYWFAQLFCGKKKEQRSILEVKLIKALEFLFNSSLKNRCLKFKIFAILHQSKLILLSDF